MGYPNRDNRGGRGGGRDFGGRSFGGERPVRPAEMHKAICSTCGNECEVPFKPSGDKPVYCRDCFAKNRSHDNDRSFGRANRDNRESPRPEFKRFNEDRPIQTPRNNELDVINSKLDQILKILSSQTEILAPAEIPVEPIVAVKKKRISKKAAIETPEEAPIE
mgnify:CR=1 FL=1